MAAKTSRKVSERSTMCRTGEDSIAPQAMTVESGLMILPLNRPARRRDMVDLAGMDAFSAVYDPRCHRYNSWHSCCEVPGISPWFGRMSEAQSSGDRGKYDDIRSTPNIIYVWHEKYCAEGSCGEPSAYPSPAKQKEGNDV